MELVFAFGVLALMLIIQIYWLVTDTNDDPNQTFYAQVDELRKAMKRLGDTVVDALRGKQ